LRDYLEEQTPKRIVDEFQRIPGRLEFMRESDLDALELQLEREYLLAANTLAQHAISAGAAGKSKRAKRRRRSGRKRDPKRLTPKQAEAIQAYADHNGDIPEAAKRCSITPKSMRDRLEGAWKKIGKRSTTNAIKAKTTKLPTDKRGQANIPAKK
jgi:hypothetical protein